MSSSSATASASPTPTSLPELACPQDNGKKTTLNGKVFTLYCGQEPSGGNLPNQPVYANNIVACAQMCASTQSCKTGSLVGFNCYLKFTVSKIGSSGANAMVMLAADNPPNAGAVTTTTSSSALPSSATATTATAQAPGSPRCGTGGSPTLRIPSPRATALLSADLFSNMDDEVRNVSLPFPMTLYGTSATTVFVSSNGILSFSPSNSWETALLPSNKLGDVAVAPYWTDLSVPFQEFTYGIWFAVDAGAGTLVVEWIIGKAGNMDEMYQFQVLYERAMPGVVTFRYFVVGANGKGVGIGVQGGGKGAQFAFDQRVICPLEVVTCDTNANTCTNGTMAG
ncbi:putative subtilase family serine protease protein [Neofusicoccum parvum UCRNP2]|uniref:Subtilase family serine protease protein n=2 Tax=Neofusicoccum parvum TaxID=310453 RepID=A0ACB5RNJ9_9PEZI|nr:putative subtilase family serine protease protein [Neofusicoccum parvum UCRNP2]GME22083.1 putative subtilase family serine protease protein [Neofusicoccum parvum]